MRSLLAMLGAVLLALVLGAPAHAAWQEARSKHFIIYADQNPEKLRAFADRLERFDQAVRYIRGMDDPELTDSQRLRVYVLKSQDAVARLAGNSMVAGFYQPWVSGSAVFVPRSAGSSDMWGLDTEQIFFHEYAHHLQLQYASAALPSWSIEGFAEFFATAEIKKDGGVIIGKFPLYRAGGIFGDFSVPMDQMLGGTYGKLNGLEVNALYGQAWLLTHYLTFEPTRRGQLSRYVAGIQAGASAVDSARAAFGDLKTLNNELDRYSKRSILALTINGRVLKPGVIQMRPLGAAEAAMMNVHIRSRRGVDQKTAPAVAADARKSAAAYPNDPFVQSALAEAEFDAGNFADAEAAADRALKADPDYVAALIHKGKAQLELAKREPAKANWDQIRKWFIRANKLDTENAEALALFYRSYAEAGQSPTRNAVQALLYAVELAPQAQELRISAVRQLLSENRIAEAKSMFAPMAFQPHSSAEWRDKAVAVMAAMTAGDGKKALAALDAGEQAAQAPAKGG